jgi:hypothetical protein
LQKEYQNRFSYLASPLIQSESETKITDVEHPDTKERNEEIMARAPARPTVRSTIKTTAKQTIKTTKKHPSVDFNNVVNFLVSDIKGMHRRSFHLTKVYGDTIM